MENLKMQHGEAIYKTGSELVFQGRLKDYQYSLLLGELIDNSRDAKSTEVRVLVRQVKAKGFRVWGLTVRDNGVGTDEDGVRKVLPLTRTARGLRRLNLTDRSCTMTRL